MSFRAALCAASLGLGLDWLVTPRLDAQGDPPGALIPCGTLRGAREGGAAGGFTAGSPPVVSTGMPPSLPSVPVVLANGMRVTPVQGNVYMLGGAGGNIALQVGSDGALLVDSGRADRADAAIATLRLLTASPIRWIINTSGGPEHAGGNDPLMRIGRRFATSNGRTGGPGDQPGAAILARQTVQNRLIAEKASECALPSTTYDVFQTRSLFFNGEGIELRHMPAANSDGDSFVFFRRSDVVVTGDIFNTNLYPLIDVEHGGSIEGTITALNQLLEITIPALKQEGGTMVIPGHGRVGDEADVSEYRDMVTIVRDRVRALVAKNMTLEQVKAQRPTLDFDGRHGASDGPSTTERFIDAVYRGVSRGPRK
jgi:cyclase